jgi:predicted nucleic acid-binding protein
MPSTIPLLDTNVLSELVRPAPDPRVLSWVERQPLIALSAITVEEVFFGLSWRPKERVRAWFESFLADSCEIFPVSLEIAQRAGELRGDLQRQGATREQADMLIAATAELHERILVTRNVRHFEGCGIRLLNPFEGSVSGA